METLNNTFHAQKVEESIPNHAVIYRVRKAVVVPVNPKAIKITQN